MRSLVVIFAMMFALPAYAGPKEDMLAADRAFSQMSVDKGAHAAFLAYMTDDVRLYEGSHPPIIGKTAAASYYAEVERANGDYRYTRLEWTPVEAEASPDGALGWTRGTWIWTMEVPGKTAVKVTGYYLTEWRREDDGTYKFDLDIGGVDKNR